jgi:predicted transcriptional regulator
MEHILLEELTEPEYLIFKVLCGSKVALSGRQIAKKAKKVSHPTAYLYLTEMEQRGFVKHRQIKRHRKWFVWYIPIEIKRKIRIR